LLEFGTELVGADDHSLVALLGASPGASTAAFIAISVLEKCFAGELTASAWLPKLKQIIPSYGVSLIDDADFCRQIRAATAAVLKVDNIPQPAARAPVAAKRA
jgi:malate dehydrogenase (quinone)